MCVLEPGGLYFGWFSYQLVPGRLLRAAPKARLLSPLLLIQINYQKEEQNHLPGDKKRKP